MTLPKLMMAASLLLLTSACDKVAGGGGAKDLLPSGPDKEPLEMTATSDYEAKFGDTDTKARFFVRGHNDDGKEPLFLQISFDKMPEGSRVVIGDTTKTADDYGSMFFDVDIRKQAAKVSLTELVNNKVALDVPMKIKMKGYKEHVFKVPKLKIGRGVAATLATVTDRPLTFEGDEPLSPGPKSLASVEAGTSFSKLVIMGPAKKLSQIDYVGVYSQVESGRTKQCDGYKKIKGNVTIKMVDYKVELYDRREGKRLEDHIVQAEDRCPMFVSVDKATKTANHYANKKDVEKWLREKLRTLDKAAANADSADKE